jgi:hypothetical protein
VTHSPGGDWFFDGIYNGLWRTDRQFNQTAAAPEVIPPDVVARENYDHIGDPSFDRAEGGRIVLPLECYYPPAGNTCGNGSFGVADPKTLAWRYYVRLAPTEIPKAMWVEASPDGKLLWTSAGKDLLAYRASDVKPANAAPGGPVIKAVRRIKGGVPPSGITGGAFYKGRLYLAGGDKDPLWQIWSVDLSDGSRRLEVERTVIGESEGIDFFSAAGGVLHWLVQPYNTHGPPTYGTDHATLLHFVPKAGAGDGGTGGTGPGGGRPSGSGGTERMRFKIKPRRVHANKRVRFRAYVTTSRGRRVRGALVTLAGHRKRTGRRGRATLILRLRRGSHTARARKAGLGSARRTVRAMRRP